jgi:hypothetical protein
MHRGLFKKNRVFAVSDESANLFEQNTRGPEELAAQVGLAKIDLLRIEEAKRQLDALQPSSHEQKRAAEGLRARLGWERPNRKRGRPGSTAADRVQMHKDADQLGQEGKKPDQIVRVLSQRYELMPSYIKRILQDASQT